MTVAADLASFVERSRYEDLSPEAVRELKLRVLDGIGCALGALDAEPIGFVRGHVAAMSRADRCTLIGGAGRSSPDLAAFYNGALVRYLDFNDSYLAPGETCHPSDNLAPVLAAAEHGGATSRDFLAALAVAYQIQCRLSDEAPVRKRGFDHTTQGSYAVAAGVSRALALDAGRTAHALAISGTAFNALRVTRTGALSHWKGLAYPNTAFGATHATLLASRGITGPLEVFEGNKGFFETIAGGPAQIDWKREDLEKVTRTIVKKYNAEIHSQSALEAAIELKRRHDIDPRRIAGIEIDIFDVAYDIIGGGEEGAKTEVRTKEEADHSILYMVAVAILDGQVFPEQYREERIRRSDVQELLRKVTVRPSEAYSRRFPAEIPCRVTIRLSDGSTFDVEKRDYEGFLTRPLTWERAAEKFRRLSAPFAGSELQDAIIDTVRSLEEVPLARLMELCSKAGTHQRNP